MRWLNKLFIVFVLIFVIVISSVVFMGCWNDYQGPTSGQGLGNEQTLPDVSNELNFIFETDYTEDEHVQRIKEKTEERLAFDFEENKIKSFNVEILYSFYTQDPEYFLVEIEYKQEFSGFFSPSARVPDSAPRDARYLTKYKHIIGRIYRDNYYIEAINNTDFVDGQSPYAVLGYENNKKYYYFGHFAIEQSGKITSIFSAYTGESNYLLLGIKALESEPWNTEQKNIKEIAQRNMLINSRNSHDANFYIFSSGNEYLY